MFNDCSALITEYASYGDFIDVIPQAGLPNDETLARTFFHHLIEGIEYLHQNGVAHLDLKCENLLLGDDFQLKITDFDMCSEIADGKLVGRGTANFRAPELIVSKCESLEAADVYSAGILLFIFRFGFFPYVEKNFIHGKSLHELLLTNLQGFWDLHKDMRGSKMQVDQDLRALFEGMVHPVPSQRSTIAQIKKSKWYQGPVYNDDVLKAGLSLLYQGDE